MAEQSYYRERVAKRHPNSTITGDGPHGVIMPNGQAVVLFADFYDARTAAECSGGRQIFVNRPVAVCQDFGYYERERATA